jgi:hypothetical protein
MMLAFVVMLACLGAKVKGFICNQWERKEMCRHPLLWLQQYRTRGKCPSFCYLDFFVTFFELDNENLCLFSTQQFSPFLSEQQHATGQAVQSLESQSHKVFGLLCAELC